MPHCALSSCENSISDDSITVMFHRFPLGNRSNLEKWIANMKFTELNPPLSSFICDAHFTPLCYERGKLKRDAVPTLISQHVESTDSRDNFHPRVTGIASTFEEKCGTFLCRICGSKLNEDEMVLLAGASNTVFEKMKCCLPLMVDNCDDFPEHICGNCNSQIENIYSFRTLSVVTETLFSHYLTTFSDPDKTERSQQDSQNETDNNKDTLWLEKLPLEGPIFCSLCEMEFTDMLHFDDHMDYHQSDLCEERPSGLLNIVCSTCGLIFDGKSKYEEHKRRQKYECKKCEHVVFSLCEKKTHDCQKDMFNFTFNIDEMETMQSLINGSNYIKDISFMDMDKQHGREIDRYQQRKLSKNFSCNICDRKFLRHINLTKHKARHEREEQLGDFRCHDCGQQFPKMRLLTQHREKIHKEGSTWVCRYCGKHTTTKLSMNIHERIHTGVKPFICEWCGNTFRSKANLSQHHAKHTGIRRHACPVCGKMFSRKSFVTTHLRVHTGERPFSCEICEQRFTQIGDMRRHRRRHNAQAVMTGHNAQSVMTIQPFIMAEDDDSCRTMNVNEMLDENSENTMVLDAKLNSKNGLHNLNSGFIIQTIVGP